MSVEAAKIKVPISENATRKPAFIKGIELNNEFDKAAYGRYKQSSGIQEKAVAKQVNLLQSITPRYGYTKDQWLENARQIGGVAAKKMQMSNRPHMKHGLIFTQIKNQLKSAREKNM